MAQLHQVVGDQAQGPVAVRIGAFFGNGQGGDVGLDTRDNLGRLAGAGPLEQCLFYISVALVKAFNHRSDAGLAAAELDGDVLLFEGTFVKLQQRLRTADCTGLAVAFGDKIGQALLLLGAVLHFFIPHPANLYYKMHYKYMIRHF